MTDRDQLELRYIADLFFREARETGDGRFVIDSRSMFELVKVLDKAAGHCAKRDKQYDKAEALLDVERDTYGQQIDDLEKELKEFRELPQLAIF
jgi:hypothetical protein